MLGSWNMKKLLAIIVLGLMNFDYVEAGTFTGKKYVYEYLKQLKTVIKKDDPTDFKELKFIRKSEGKELMTTAGKPNRSDNSGKRKTFRYDAYIFQAIYNSGHEIKFFVDADYAKNSDKAEKFALHYAKAIGQIPAFLREASTNLYTINKNPSKGVENIIIGKGNYRWWADFSQKQFLIYPQNKWTPTDLIIMHEAAHLTIYAKLILDDTWINALMTDKKYITKYATTLFGEDISDTISFWVAVRCSDKSDKIKEKILKAIPNRINALDKFVKDNKLSTSPMVCS